MTAETNPERVRQAAETLHSHIKPVLTGKRVGVVRELGIWLSAEVGPHVSSGKGVFNEEPDLGGVLAQEAKEFTLDEREKGLREILRRLGVDFSRPEIGDGAASYNTRYPDVVVLQRRGGQEADEHIPFYLYHWAVVNTRLLARKSWAKRYLGWVRTLPGFGRKSPKREPVYNSPSEEKA